MEIHAKTIPHNEHRYKGTVGDYWTDRNGLKHFRVSEMSNPDYSFCVLIHEIVEQYLTEKRGISEKSISAFDIKFEKEREKGLVKDDAEPGDDPRAPYRLEHRFAENIERQVAYELKIDWQKYTDEVMSL